MEKTKRILAGLFVIMMVFTGMPIYGIKAETADGTPASGDYEYEVNEDGESVTITKYTGTGGIVEIPPELDEKKVIRIGYEAFCRISNLTSVTIPEGVTSIGGRAFYECRDLAEISMPEGLLEIGFAAFAGGCDSLISVDIPQSVVDIGNEAFDYCRNLEHIHVAAGNKNYDSRGDCNALIETASNKLLYGSKNTIIPKGITVIENGAFSGRTIENISIPEGVLRIGNWAFQTCGNLKSVSIPQSVTEIGDRAFEACESLKSLTLPEGITDIALAAFSHCESLENINIPRSLTRIKNELFSSCKSLKSVNIPDNVTEIGHWAFRNCSSLKEITIPKSVSTIEEDAFINCSSLKSIRIPGNAPEIREHAFGYTSTYTNDGMEYEKLSGIVIYGNQGSTAEKYAKDNGFAFQRIPDQKPDTSISCKKKSYKVAYGTKPFTINASSKSKLAFTSSKPKVASVHKNTGKVTIKGTGTATITIKAGKNSVKATVKVVPKEPAVKSVKTLKGRKLSIKWAKDKRASGYQVQVSTDRRFKKIAKAKKLSKTSYTFTKLKTGKKYYVRLRSYKKSGKDTLYSAWSKAKQSSKIKK